MKWYITPEEYSIAQKNGISRDTLEHRVRYHCWDIKKAITEPIREKGILNEWFDLAESNGIEKSTFINRIYKLKWSYEKAATYKKDARRKYPELVKQKLDENGIKYHTFLKRIEIGWDMERASTEKTWDKNDSLKHARSIQRELEIGPYKTNNDFWKLLKKGSK